MAPVIRRLPGRRPRWGNLRRERPFSKHYGYDRGRPVDRRCIEDFLRRMSDRMAGDVLEVRDPGYGERFGGAGARVHVVDLDPANPRATVVADLCDPRTLPTVAYDCVLLTQTLQFLADREGALVNLWASLRPGGSLLVTVPCLARIDHELPGCDYVRYTPAGLKALLDRCCPGGVVSTEGGGNLVVALSVLLGLAEEDLRPRDMAVDDAVFPVIACGEARKPSAAVAPA